MPYYITARVHLEGLGFVPAVRADELRPGDEVMWDHGNRTSLVDIQPAGTHTLTLTLSTVFGSYTRLKPADAPVAAFRDGRWLGGAPITRMVCRVPVLQRGGAVCESTVDAFGRCRRGHYPSPDHLAIQYPTATPKRTT